VRAKDIMSDGAVSIAADATLLEAASQLVNTRVSAMPVLDEHGAMVGIVSEVDLLPWAAIDVAALCPPTGKEALYDPQLRRVRDIMSRTVVSVDENAGLEQVAALMISNRVKRLPVRRGEAIVGIVSRVDLLRAMLSRTGPGVAIGAGPVAAENDQLRRDVLAVLKEQDALLGQFVDAVPMNGVVHLWGAVPNMAVLKLYCDTARAVPGVKSVVSHMQVLRGGGWRAAA
jgi:CBS domain-containing protein